MSVSVDAVERTLCGACALDQLPPLHKKVVRIFVSSTFSDTKEERNALMERVYPKIANLCRDKYGLEFQVVDMRWGVPEQAADNHTTTELCLQEIVKCQEVSVGPNFVAILGNKYGYRPIPSVIPLPEMEALCAVAEEESDTRWSLVNEWYLRDDNSVPPVYFLQPISRMLPHYNNTENQESRKQAHNEWNSIHTSLIVCLRSTASKALEKGLMTSEMAHKYYMSVTESEITYGVIRSQNDVKESALCLVRQIPDIEQHLNHTKACKFVDLTGSVIDSEAQAFMQQLRDTKMPKVIPETNLTKVEISWNASGAEISMEEMDGTEMDGADLNKVMKAANTFLHRQSSVAEHRAYLSNICSDFFEKITSMINRAGTHQEKLYDKMVTEVLQHWHFAKLRCEVFEGRLDILKKIDKYIASDNTLPYIIYGNSGCGKTSIIAKAVQNMLSHHSQIETANQEDRILILRFLGTTPHTSNIQQVIASICEQLSRVCQRPWVEPERFSELVKEFHMFLSQCAVGKTLVLFIDSIDQLMPVYGAYKMTWLPDELPKNVKIVLSSLDEGYTIVKTLKDRYPSAYSSDVLPLEKHTGLTIVNKWLSKIDRKIETHQIAVVVKALEMCGLPLYARIMFDHVRRWKSYEEPSFEELETTIKGAINKLFDQMEVRFGAPLVKHSLAFLTASRHGLSEVELEHILSLDDLLLGKIFNFWRPPIRRIPPLLWTRVRAEINSYIVERSADDILVICWYHRQFIAATKERYLSADKTFCTYIHTILTEYFQGKWSCGKQKPFEYTQAQQSRFELENIQGLEDRKVPSQPYVFQGRTQGNCYNQRKISELPFHLIKSGQRSKLKDEIFFNFEWLIAKIKGSSSQSLLQEFDVFMLADKEIRKDIEMKIMHSTLQLARPYIVKYPDSLSYELSGRLARYINTHTRLTTLVKQCDTLGIKYCPVVPLLTVFESAQLGLKQNITFRKAEQWQHGGAMTCSKDFKNLYIADYDDNGMLQLSTWDIESGDIVQTVVVGRQVSTATYDVPKELIVHSTGDYILLMYTQKYYEGLHRETFTGSGYVDVIKISDGTVSKTISGNLYKRDFVNSICYITENWIAVRYGSQLHLVSVFGTESTKYSHPHMLSHDEKKFVLSRSKKTVVSYNVGEERKHGMTSTKRTVIRDFETKDDLGELDAKHMAYAMSFTSDDSILVVGHLFGIFYVYNSERLSARKLINPKKVMTIPAPEKITTTYVDRSDDNGSDSEEEAKHAQENQEHKLCRRLSQILSKDNKLMISCHQGPTQWEAFLWNLETGQFIGRVAKPRNLQARYPNFTHDSKHVVVACKKSIKILSTDDVSVERKYYLAQDIRDFYTSETSLHVAVLQGKEVVILDSDVGIENENGPNKPKGRRKRDHLNKSNNDTENPSLIILNSEVKSSINQMNAVELTETPKGLVVDEIKIREQWSPLTTKNAIEEWVSPNGTKQIQLFSKNQIVDISHDEIKYSPKEGDILHKTNADKLNTYEKIDALKSAMTPIELSIGDKIVGNNGKIRLKIANITDKFQLLGTPCHAIINSINDHKAICAITIYRQTILTVSDKYMITVKRRQSGDFITVYSMDDKGKLLTTHAVEGTVACARLSVDNTQLLVVNNELVLWVFNGDNFISIQCKINKIKTENNFTVRNIVSCPLNQDIIILAYSAGALTVATDTSYTAIDLQSKSYSKTMSPNPAFDDISQDGSLAIDSHLSLYDCKSGSLKITLPYINTCANMQCQCRISDDNRYIVFIDKQDDSLHVIKMLGSSPSYIAHCFAHAPLLPPLGGFNLRQYGRVISVQNNHLMLFVIKDPEGKVQGKVQYVNERTRAETLVPNSMPFNLTARKTSERFLQHEALPNITKATSTVIVEDFVASLGK